MVIDSIFETKTLAGLFRSNEFASVAAPHLSSNLFEGAMRQNLAKLALDFFDRYHTHMTDAVFVHEMTKLAKAGKIKSAEIPIYSADYMALKSVDLSDWKYVLESLIGFIKQREYKALVEDMVARDMLEQCKFDEIEKRFDKISRITMRAEKKPVDFYSNEAIDLRTKRREDELAKTFRGISTGIKKLDDVMPRGGWCPKELYSISGAAKLGKTMALLWFAYVATLQGFNVPYFSCEVSSEVIEDRLDALVSRTEIKDLTKHIKYIQDKLKVSRPTGNIYIYEYPTKTLTVRDMSRRIERLQMEKGITVDMAVADYAGIMKPARYYKDNDLKEEAGIYEDLRQLAGIFGIPVLTGNQNNRSGAKKSVTDGTDTAGTFEKIAIVDGNLTISASKEEMRDGIIRLRLSEMRNAPPKSFKISTAYNMGLFYKEMIEEEAA